jgi:hypothetical protein
MTKKDYYYKGMRKALDMISRCIFMPKSGSEYAEINYEDFLKVKNEIQFAHKKQTKEKA